MKKCKSQIRKVGNYIKNHRKQSVIVLVLVLVIIIALVVSLVFKGNGKDLTKATDDKVTAVTAEGIVKDEEYKNLKFSNISLIKKGKVYTLTADVTNTSDKDVDIKQVYIPIKNKDGNTLVSLLGYIGDKLKPNETRTITASTSVDLSKAVSKEITENNK